MIHNIDVCVCVFSKLKNRLSWSICIRDANPLRADISEGESECGVWTTERRLLCATETGSKGASFVSSKICMLLQMPWTATILELSSTIDTEIMRQEAQPVRNPTFLSRTFDDEPMVCAEATMSLYVQAGWQGFRASKVLEQMFESRAIHYLGIFS